MKLTEAQELSIIGLAEFAAMKDVIWLKGQENPYVWITNGYKEGPKAAGDRVKDSDDWWPMHPKQKSR